MTEQLVDIDSLACGMEQINKEKPEIKNILRFLKPYIVSIAGEELGKRSSQPISRDRSVEILSVSNQKGSSITLWASTGWPEEGVPDYVLQFSNSEPGMSLNVIYNNSVNSDPLSSDYVGACRALLTPLFKKVAEYRPEVLNRAKVYYAAAERTRSRN